MIEYRTASLAEIELAVDWAAGEGWNPGLEDAAAFHAADPAGFFVATDGGEPVASISVVNHGDTFAFLGLYIVRAGWRGKGIGLGLWTHAMEHAGGRTVGLDGVADQQDNYRRSGFVHAGSTRRFTGAVTGRTDGGTRLAQADDIAGLVAREARASGVAKPAYLTRWFSHTETRQTLIMEDQGTLRGFCTARQCREGTKVGPLVADSPEVAERLLEHAATLFPAPLTIDLPDAAVSRLMPQQRFGMVETFGTARMYKGAPIVGQSDLYAVASLELG